MRPYALGYGYIEARTDTTQQSGQTPDKEVEIKNIILFMVSGYTETETTGMLFPLTVWPFSVAVDINNVFSFYFLMWSLSRLLCCVDSGFNVAAALGCQSVTVLSAEFQRILSTSSAPLYTLSRAASQVIYGSVLHDQYNPPPGLPAPPGFPVNGM